MLQRQVPGVDYDIVTVKAGQVALLRQAGARKSYAPRAQLGVPPALVWPSFHNIVEINEWWRRRTRLSRALIVGEPVMVLTEPAFHTEVEIMLPDGTIGCISPVRLVGA